MPDVAKVASATVVGVEAVPVEVEVRAAGGLPAIVVVGLPDSAVKEARDRVKSAIVASGYQFPGGRVTVNLAPGDLKKEGPAFDLPIALGILVAHGPVAPKAVKGIVAVGECALDGTLRPIRGVLPIALLCRKVGKALLCPRANAAEAAVVHQLDVIPVGSVAEAVAVLAGEVPPPPLPTPAAPAAAEAEGEILDFADVRGQAPATRALLLAAAGGHNALMLGPPGTGKTMLAQRLPTILPPLTADEALESTAVHSVAGLLAAGTGLLRDRPFRAPHHSISGPGLVGGGTIPRPGEVSLAHHGVLFLDEMGEFPRHVLEELRQPLEDGKVTIGRAAGSTTFPARFMLVGASNPCPCGFLGAAGNRCQCTPPLIERYRRRLSGPLLDRIDLHVEVPLLAPESLLHETGQGTPSATLRANVCAARERQQHRFRDHPGVRTNAQMGARLTRTVCTLDPAGKSALEQAMRGLDLSARAFGRILKLARTIADVDGAAAIGEPQVFEAIQYRALDRRVEA